MFIWSKLVGSLALALQFEKEQGLEPMYVEITINKTFLGCTSSYKWILYTIVSYMVF